MDGSADFTFGMTKQAHGDILLWSYIKGLCLRIERQHDSLSHWLVEWERPRRRLQRGNYSVSKALESLGGFLFRWRDYTSLPALMVLWAFSSPNAMFFGIGIGFMLLGESVRLWSLQSIGGASRTRGNHPGSDLARTGPYATVRNPLYIGNLLLAVGVGFLAGRIWTVAIAFGMFVAQYVPIVRWEESRLRERFGEAYAVYCREVPRWFPQAISIPTSPMSSDEVRRVLRTERRTFLSFAAVTGLFALRWWLATTRG